MVTEAETKDNKELEASTGQFTAFEAADGLIKQIRPSLRPRASGGQTDRQLQSGPVEPECTTSPSELELRGC